MSIALCFCLQLAGWSRSGAPVGWMYTMGVCRSVLKVFARVVFEFALAGALLISTIILVA